MGQPEILEAGVAAVGSMIRPGPFLDVCLDTSRRLRVPFLGALPSKVGSQIAFM